MIDTQVTEDSTFRITEQDTSARAIQHDWMSYLAKYASLNSGTLADRAESIIGLILLDQERHYNLVVDKTDYNMFFTINSRFNSLINTLRLVTEQDVYSDRIKTSIPEWERRLQQFSELEENWDSYGGLPIANNAIQKARTILSLLSAFGISEQVFVVPCASGGVGIDFDLPDRGIDIEISPDGENVDFEVLFRKTKTAKRGMLDGGGIEELIREILE